jgi:hypothetical protein
MKEIELQINLDVIMDLLKGERLTTEKDGVEITIYNPEVWEITEEEDLATIVKWRKLIEELSNLKEKRGDI